MSRQRRERQSEASQQTGGSVRVLKLALLARTSETNFQHNIGRWMGDGTVTRA